MAHRAGGACWNCGTYYNQCCHIGKREFVIEQLLAVLKEVEWNMEFDGELCPECKADRDGNEHWPPGHREDCNLAAAIAEAEAILA